MPTPLMPALRARSYFTDKDWGLSNHTYYTAGWVKLERMKALSPEGHHKHEVHTAHLVDLPISRTIVEVG